MWIDPSTSTYVVVMASRVHPEGKGDAVPLRGEARDDRRGGAEGCTAGGLRARAPEAAGAHRGHRPHGPRSPRPARPSSPGIDVLRAEGFARLAGAKVRCSPTTRASPATAPRPSDPPARGEEPDAGSALLSPEHGIRGTLDDKVPSGTDEKTGLAHPLALR
jgi:hypothetical protein